MVVAGAGAEVDATVGAGAGEATSPMACCAARAAASRLALNGSEEFFGSIGSGSGAGGSESGVGAVGCGCAYLALSSLGVQGRPVAGLIRPVPVPNSFVLGPVAAAGAAAVAGVEELGVAAVLDGVVVADAGATGAADLGAGIGALEKEGVVGLARAFSLNVGIFMVLYTVSNICGATPA